MSSAMRAAPPRRLLVTGVDMQDESPDDMSDITKRQAENGRRAVSGRKQMSTLRRRTVIAGAMAAPLVPLAAPYVSAQAGKPYNGTTINCSCFQTTYYEYLKNYFPEFQEKTGIKVNFTMQAFPVYNQRTDLELSTKGSAIDACNITFIYSGRWIGAGWFTPLDPFLKDPKHTPADWDP